MALVGTALSNGAMESAMKDALEPVRTTVIGGAIFLVPIVIVVFFGSKLLGFVEGLLQPLEARIGELAVGGVAVTTLLAIVLIVLLCYGFGLLAQTRRGRGVLQWAQNGLALVIPSFGMYNELFKELGGEHANASVVLVPTDAGWNLALCFEAKGDGPRLVFIPGSPQWTQGSLALAPAEDVRPTDLTVQEMIALLRHCGRSSEPLTARLIPRIEK